MLIWPALFLSPGLCSGRIAPGRSGSRCALLGAAGICPRCFYQASFARKHRCYKKMKATTRRVKQVQQLRKQLISTPTVLLMSSSSGPLILPFVC